MLIELVENDLGFGAALQFNDDAHAVAIALVAHVADFVDDLFVDQFGDALDENVLVDLVGNFADDDRLAALVEVFDGAFGAHKEAAAAGLVGLLNAALAVNEAASREVRSLHVLQHLGEPDVRVVHHFNGGVDDLGEIVRRDVGRHTDRDAVGAVDDEVGNARGQNKRLVGGLVVVGDEVHGFHFDVGEQLAADLLEAALGVPHGRGRVAVDGAKVTLAIDQGITHAEGLRHAYQ